MNKKLFTLVVVICLIQRLSGSQEIVLGDNYGSIGELEDFAIHRTNAISQVQPRRLISPLGGNYSLDSQDDDQRASLRRHAARRLFPEEVPNSNNDNGDSDSDSEFLQNFDENFARGNNSRSHRGDLNSRSDYHYIGYEAEYEDEDDTEAMDLDSQAEGDFFDFMDR